MYRHAGMRDTSCRLKCLFVLGARRSSPRQLLRSRTQPLSCSRNLKFHTTICRSVSFTIAETSCFATLSVQRYAEPARQRHGAREFNVPIRERRPLETTANNHIIYIFDAYRDVGRVKF